MNNIIYEGFFIIDELHGNLEKDIQFKHITTEFRPKVTHEHLYGTEATFMVDGYANDNINEGLSVYLKSCNSNELKEIIIDKIYNGDIKIPHITLSVSATGKPINTSKLNFSQFHPNDEYLIHTKFGGFNGKEPIFNKEK